MSQVKSNFSLLGESQSCRVAVWLNRVENDEEVNHFVGKQRMRLLVTTCVSSENEARSYNTNWLSLWLLTEYGGSWWGKQENL